MYVFLCRYGLRWSEESTSHRLRWFAVGSTWNCCFRGRISVGFVYVKGSIDEKERQHESFSSGNQEHGIGDFRIPTVALANMTGHQVNINLTHPHRGISRSSNCSYERSWQMYFCRNTLNYRMLIIESMDSDTERRRLSPVAVFSDNGFIDLINGPQDHGCCNGYTCRKRVSTFMSIVETDHIYRLYLSSSPPEQIRFRLLHSDQTDKVIVALRYDSLQEIDVYGNDRYVSPTNRDTTFINLMLTDQSNNVSLSSTVGSNYFDR